MIVTYLRSSSYGCHEMCAMKYFMEYILGWRGKTHIKAEKGTIVHKVLEILAIIKLKQQEGYDRKTFDDEIVGRVHMQKYDIDRLTKKCYDYYVGFSPNEWTTADYKECLKWVYKAIEYQGGKFDPRNMDIVAPEQAFDITINEPWAMYSYQTADGTNLEGLLSIKGTIDQISRIDDNTYMVLDWKTGRRWNWAKDKEKTYEALQSDHQLMMYYYACQCIYPDIDNFVMCIYFINDGGPFNVCFSREDLPRIERMLQKKFEDIRDTGIPMRNRSWKCRSFCHYGKNSFRGTDVKPIKERRESQVCKKGETMTMCEQTNYCLEHRPANSVIQHMSAPGHVIDYYKAPGEAG